jgi:hypothetical protein
MELARLLLGRSGAVVDGAQPVRRATLFDCEADSKIGFVHAVQIHGSADESNRSEAARKQFARPEYPLSGVVSRENDNRIGPAGGLALDERPANRGEPYPGGQYCEEEYDGENRSREGKTA